MKKENLRPIATKKNIIKYFLGFLFFYLLCSFFIFFNLGILLNFVRSGTLLKFFYQDIDVILIWLTFSSLATFISTLRIFFPLIKTIEKSIIPTFIIGLIMMVIIPKDLFGFVIIGIIIYTFFSYIIGLIVPSIWLLFRNFSSYKTEKKIALITLGIMLGIPLMIIAIVIN
jgi:hypothetical protein